ncbi:MAG: peptidase M15 [Bacteroidaceae bacterium]|nr:peptidase M15 [Bacteroidaceae bacterium]
MKYFSINELTSSATALREGIDNRPNKCAYHLLHVLVDQLLDPIREAWGEPIVVSSGYRCKQLNTLIGGVKNSHHILGCAADIIAGSRSDHRRLFRLIVRMQQEGQIRFTQLIAEKDYRWLHISYVPGMLRNQIIDVNVEKRLSR